MNKATITKSLLAAVMAMIIASTSTGSALAETMTRTMAYTHFRYEGEIPKFVWVYFNALGTIISLDTEDRYKVFRVVLRGDFFSDDSCASYTHSRPTCYDQRTGTPDEPLEVDEKLHVGDKWPVGDCDEEQGNRSYGTSYVYGASDPATDSDCKAPDCG